MVHSIALCALGTLTESEVQFVQLATVVGVKSHVPVPQTASVTQRFVESFEHLPTVSTQEILLLQALELTAVPSAFVSLMV